MHTSLFVSDSGDSAFVLDVYVFVVLFLTVLIFSKCFKLMLIVGLQDILFVCVQKTPLNELIYIADNLAYFPYQQQDEPLFIMHQLDIIVSVSGSNLLQSFKEVCMLSSVYEIGSHYRFW